MAMFVVLGGLVWLWKPILLSFFYSFILPQLMWQPMSFLPPGFGVFLSFNFNPFTFNL
jgi:hypothetical protein